MVKVVQKLAKAVKQRAIDFERDINLQKRQLPRILELDPASFMSIWDLVTHECLQMIMLDWIKTKDWAQRILEGDETEPESEEEGCLY